MHIIIEKYDHSILDFSDDPIWQDRIMVKSIASRVGAAKFRFSAKAWAGSKIQNKPFSSLLPSPLLHMKANGSMH